MSELTHGKQCRKPQCHYLGVAGRCLFKLQYLAEVSILCAFYKTCHSLRYEITSVVFTYVGAFFTSLISHFFPPLMLPKIKPSIATTVLIPLSVNGDSRWNTLQTQIFFRIPIFPPRHSMWKALLLFPKRRSYMVNKDQIFYGLTPHPWYLERILCISKADSQLDNGRVITGA